MALQDLNKLCTPAQLYLFITLFSLVIMIYQNSGTYDNVLCVGNYECYNSPNKAVLVFVKLIYISFWTFVLQMICKGGYKNFSWFLVLLPVILFMLFLIFGMGPWNYRGRFIEGMTNLTDVRTAKDGANYVSEQVNNFIDTKLENISKLETDKKMSIEKIIKETTELITSIKDTSTKAAADVPSEPQTQ